MSVRMRLGSIFVSLLLLGSIFFCGCLEEEENNTDPDLLVFNNLSVGTRSGYTEEFYRNSVLEVSVSVTNKDVKPGSFTIKMYIDNFEVDSKTVWFNASEDKTIKFTTLDEQYSQFPLEDRYLNTTGLHTIRVGSISKNITVLSPPVVVNIKSLEWKESDGVWEPWISLRVRNTADRHFYLGGSFAVKTSEGIFQGYVESWNLLVGETNNTGYYRFPADAIADVEIVCHDLQSNVTGGSDIRFDSVRVYAGFPWMDFTGGIIGEADFVD